jgi:hypothetical protein
MDTTNGLEEERFDDRTVRAGQTVALLNLPMANTAWPKLSSESGCWDGIFVRIYAHSRGGYVADGNANRPDWSRKQFNIMRLMPTYAAAKQLLAEWFPKAVAFCAAPVTEETCPMPHIVGATPCRRDNHCRECGWEETREERRAYKAANQGEIR